MSTLKVNNLQDLGADAVVTNGVIEKAALPSGSILQVVSILKTDTFSSNSTSMVDITGMSATITPSSSSSNILVAVTMNVSADDGQTGGFQIVRTSTAIGIGAAAGSRVRVSHPFRGISSNWGGSGAFMILDSPATASAVTYKVQGRVEASSFYLNRSGFDADSAAYHRGASTITLMEVAG